MTTSQLLRALVTSLAVSAVLTGCVSDDNGDTGVTTSRTWKDVAYGDASAAQTLDIWLPSTGDGPFPVVIWIHGGAFRTGSKSNPQSLKALHNAGLAVASINYRLSGEATWPAQLDDLRSVVRFVRTHAATYLLDPDRIGSWGASAGGHLSAMIGIALASDPETRIQATVDWFGPTDLYNMDADIALSGVARCTGTSGAADSPESAFIGAIVSNNRALSDAASPVAHVGDVADDIDIPPFLIMHGGKDCHIGANQSVRLHTAIQRRFGIAKSTYVFLPNGTHGGGDMALASTEQIVVDFLASALKAK